MSYIAALDPLVIPTASPLLAESIQLRPYTVADLDEFYAAARESIAELQRWLPWCHADYSREEAAAWIESRPAAWVRSEEFSFLITSAETGQLLGGCGLNQFDHLRLRANLGYWVRTRCTGRGVATAATRALATFGFRELRLERIEIVAAVGNKASQRVAEKTGAWFEGIARRRLRVHGQQHDAATYSLIPEDLGLPRPR